MTELPTPEARLPGFTGPLPDLRNNFRPIQNKYRGSAASARLSQFLFDEIADQLKEGIAVPQPITSDVEDHRMTPWEAAVYWKRHGRTYAVLFPKFVPSNRHHVKSYATRHIEIYVKGEVPSMDELKTVVTEFVDDCVRTYKRLYYHDSRTTDGSKP